MTQGEALDLLNAMLWEAAVICGPVLLVILIVGVLISVLQATTQLQEMTLSYVPKMAVTIGLLILLGPWMIGRITGFAVAAFQRIPGAG